MKLAAISSVAAVARGAGEVRRPPRVGRRPVKRRTNAYREGFPSASRPAGGRACEPSAPATRYEESSWSLADGNPDIRSRRSMELLSSSRKANRSSSSANRTACLAGALSIPGQRAMMSSQHVSNALAKSDITIGPNWRSQQRRAPGTRSRAGSPLMQSAGISESSLSRFATSPFRSGLS